MKRLNSFISIKLEHGWAIQPHAFYLKPNKTKNLINKMRLTYEPTTDNWSSKRDPKFMQSTLSLEHPMDDMTLPDFMDTMVVPMLKSMGYSQVSINAVIDTDEDA